MDLFLCPIHLCSIYASLQSFLYFCHGWTWCYAFIIIQVEESLYLQCKMHNVFVFPLVSEITWDFLVCPLTSCNTHFKHPSLLLVWAKPRHMEMKIGFQWFFFNGLFLQKTEGLNATEFNSWWLDLVKSLHMDSTPKTPVFTPHCLGLLLCPLYKNKGNPGFKGQVQTKADSPQRLRCF